MSVSPKPVGAAGSVACTGVCAAEACTAAVRCAVAWVACDRVETSAVPDPVVTLVVLVLVATSVVPDPVAILVVGTSVERARGAASSELAGVPSMARLAREASSVVPADWVQTEQEQEGSVPVVSLAPAAADLPVEAPRAIAALRIAIN